MVISWRSPCHRPVAPCLSRRVHTTPHLHRHTHGHPNPTGPPCPPARVTGVLHSRRGPWRASPSTAYPRCHHAVCQLNHLVHLVVESIPRPRQLPLPHRLQPSTSRRTHLVHLQEGPMPPLTSTSTTTSTHARPRPPTPTHTLQTLVLSLIHI